jgi:hypothetical protein
MKRHAVTISLAALSAVALAAVTGAWLFHEKLLIPFSPSQERGTVVAVSDYRLSGPYTHDNLTIFLIHGPETLDTKNLLTLQEALEQNKAVVHETEAVNQLTIENLSADEEVYVQSGDIVKGGKQDRTFPYDAVIGPKSGPIAMDSFCVEHGRWQQRGKEKVICFDSSGSNLRSVSFSAGESSKANQREVWDNVTHTQDRLRKKLGKEATETESESSLQLTLETSAVREAIAPYRKVLGPATAGKDDVIGYVAVINGQIVSADVYASRLLFRKLWSKLLDGSAVEAFIEADPKNKFDVPGEPIIRTRLAEVEGAAAHNETGSERTYVLVRKMGPLTLSESCDQRRGNVVLHRSFQASAASEPEH